MFSIEECLTNRSQVSELKVLDSNLLAYSTRTHGINIFSYEDCSLKLRINKVHELLNPSTNSTTFSPNGEYLAFTTKGVIYIFHMPSRILSKTIYTNNEEINILSFDLESKYIIAGTMKGRVHQYRYDGSSLLSRLYSFKKSNQKESLTHNFVNSFAFYKNRVACGNNNGEITIVDLHSRVNKATLFNSQNCINALCFLNENLILSGTIDGKLYINNLENEKQSKIIDTGFTTVSNIIHMPNKNYVMISGDTNYVSIYDIKKYKILHNKYLEFDDIVEKLALVNDDTLIVALKNFNICRVELPSTSKLKLLVEANSFEEAYNLCEKDFMLKDSKEYKLLQEKYEKLCAQAIQALINQQKKVAMQLMGIFDNVASKKDEIAMIFKAYEHYPKLQSLYLEKKYSLAYALCGQFPALENTFQYKKMEESWKDAFRSAQRQIILGRDEMAKSLLSEYITVTSKRPMIKLIINHNKKFIEFLKAIETKNFQIVYEIAKINESFTQIPTYKYLENDIEHGLLEIKNSIKKGEVDLASTNLAKYQKLPDFVFEVAKLTQDCQNMQKLKYAYEINDFKLCYKILDTHSGLEFSELGLLLEKHWSKLAHTAEEFALKGNLKEIKTTLGELLDLQTRREKIGDLLRVSFHTKTKMFLAKKSFQNAENLIYTYIDIFGQDMEINSLMRIYENSSKTQLAITQNSRQARDNWINSPIIMGS